jgi:hypothetical protein
MLLGKFEDEGIHLTLHRSFPAPVYVPVPVQLRSARLSECNLTILNLVCIATVSVSQVAATIAPALALPPPDDPPEEVLRTEIITDARSPIDGSPLTAAEYAELQTQLAAPNRTPELSPKVRQIIFLLQVRRTLLRFLPFLPL